MRETTDTSQHFELQPEGQYTMTVNGRPEKRRTSGGKTTYRIWKFKVITGGSTKIISILLFPWESEELLAALGAVEVDKHKWDWDDEAVDGKTIIANIRHVPDNNGDLREKLFDVTAIDKSWDE